MDRSKVGKLMLLFLALPFAAYMLINFITGYIPPTESYKKTPDQFEEAFNAQMAQYGMSIDVDSVNFSYGDDLKKVVPVVCEDGSKITCIYYPTSERSKALINYIVFEQELTEEGATVYIEPLLRFLLDEFETVMLENKDKSLGLSSGVSYNEALRRCEEFVNGDKDKEKFFIYPESGFGTAVTIKKQTDKTTSLSISLSLF